MLSIWMDISVNPFEEKSSTQKNMVKKCCITATDKFQFPVRLLSGAFFCYTPIPKYAHASCAYTAAPTGSAASSKRHFG